MEKWEITNELENSKYKSLSLNSRKKIDSKKSEQGFRDTCVIIIKKSKIHVIRILEKEEKEDRAENIFKEILAENFPNLAKEIKLHIQEAE